MDGSNAKLNKRVKSANIHSAIRQGEGAYAAVCLLARFASS